jgi:3-hydroxymyristoyl/3-hydroxydecanoyl-(acyl carrier protein) dehydratase
MSEDATFTIPPEHPALTGHFPGNPVVPGVVILDHVIDRVARRAGRPGAIAEALPRVKFVGVVRPGQQVSVAVKPGRREGRWQFECRVADEIVAQGDCELTIDGEPTGPHE